MGANSFKLFNDRESNIDLDRERKIQNFYCGVDTTATSRKFKGNEIPQARSSMATNQRLQSYLLNQESSYASNRELISHNDEMNQSTDYTISFKKKNHAGNDNSAHNHQSSILQAQSLDFIHASETEMINTNLKDAYELSNSNNAENVDSKMTMNPKGSISMHNSQKEGLGKCKSSNIFPGLTIASNVIDEAENEGCSESDESLDSATLEQKIRISTGMISRNPETNARRDTRLHILCKSPRAKVKDLRNMLYQYPEDAYVKDVNGQLPLHLISK